MNATLLDGSRKDASGAFTTRVKEIVSEHLVDQGCRITDFPLAGMKIRPCRGDFNCWSVTPGRCSQQDDQERILSSLVNAPVWVMITPITFGGYSSVLKRALDRVIPILLPFFIRVDGEIHHPQRYPRKRHLVMIGVLPCPNLESERIFRSLVERNARNMGKPEVTTLVLTEGTDEAALRRAVQDGIAFGNSAL